MAWCYLHRRLTGQWSLYFKKHHKAVERLNKKLHGHRVFLNAKFATIKPDIEKERALGVEYQACSACGFNSARVDEVSDPVFVVECRVCGTRETVLRVECPTCGNSSDIDDLEETGHGLNCGFAEIILRCNVYKYVTYNSLKMRKYAYHVQPANTLSFCLTIDGRHSCHMGEGKEFFVETTSTCANCHRGHQRGSQSGHRPGIGDLQADGPAVARAVSGAAVGGTGKGRSASRASPRYPGKEGAGRRRSDAAHQAAGATHWSVRTMAGAQGISRKRSADLEAAQSQAPSRQDLQAQPRQALRREAPRCRRPLSQSAGQIPGAVRRREKPNPSPRSHPARLPMKKGRCGTMTHDYKRNGTTTLFAALSMLDGKVIGDCMPRHRHQEFIRFLKKIDAETPAELDLHLIVDNYGDPQASAGEVLAPATSTLPSALHPDVEFLVEPGGAVVPRNHRQAHPPRQSSKACPS